MAKRHKLLWLYNRQFVLLARFFAVCTMGSCGFYVLLLLFLWQQGGSFYYAPEDNSILEKLSMMNQIIGTFSFISLIGMVLFALVWLYSSTHNVQVLGGTPAYSAYWAILGFFIPIFCLFRPYQMVEDLWDIYFEDNKPTLLIKIWWLTWLFGFWGSSSMIFIPRESFTPSNWLLVMMGVYILLIISAYCLSQIIQFLFQAQEQEASKHKRIKNMKY